MNSQIHCVMIQEFYNTGINTGIFGEKKNSEIKVGLILFKLELQNHRSCLRNKA